MFSCCILEINSSIHLWYQSTKIFRYRKEILYVIGSLSDLRDKENVASLF